MKHSFVIGQRVRGVAGGIGTVVDLRKRGAWPIKVKWDSGLTGWSAVDYLVAAA